MAAICGIVNLRDEDIISKTDLNSMLQSLAHHGIAVVHQKLSNNVGLGQLSFSDSPKDKFLLDNHCDLHIVADSHIHNRPDLFLKLNIAPTEQSKYTDSLLILTAYQKWGEGCSEHLLGDFAFAIWDEKEKRFFCSRDQMGCRPFYFYKDSNRFIFASEPATITTVRRVEKKLNRNKLTTLVLPSARSRFWGESWFENIYPLPAGTNLMIDSKGFRQNKYWQPKYVDKLPYKTDEETLEAFQALMFEAVTARLNDEFPVTALLSGGLDSSAIVAVAACVLGKQNKELVTFSAVLPNENDDSLTDERYFINQFRDWQNVSINYITAPDKGPFSDLEKLVALKNTPDLSSRHYLMTSFADAAQEHNSRMILFGGGGELGATYHCEEFYLESFLNFNWITLWRELKQRKQIDGHPLWKIFRSHILKPLAPSFLLPKTKKDNLYTQHNPLQKDFAQSLIDQLPDSSKQSKHQNSFNHRRNQHRFQLNAHNKSHGLGSTINGQVGLSFPLMDIRLLEFCLAAPVNLKVRNGYKRYLVRGGLDKILPPKIQWRNSKDAFSPDYLRRYKAQQKQAQDFLSDIKLNDPVRSIVDVEKIKELAALRVEDNELNTMKEITARDLVPQGVYLIHFLRQFSEFQI